MTKEELMKLDEQFDLDTSIGGVDAWVSYFADNGVMVLPHHEDIKERENIRESMKGSFSLPNFSLRWKPMDATLSNDCSLGYTYGSYIRKYTNTNGEEVVSTGKYTTIWQKQKDDSWKIILDIGN